MAKKNSEARSGSPKRNEKAVRIDVDFEDFLAAAVASVIIKRPKKRKFTSRR